MRGIFVAAVGLLAPQEGLCFVDAVSYPSEGAMNHPAPVSLTDF